MVKLSRQSFTEKQACIIYEVVDRKGVVMPQDMAIIAESCGCSRTYVSSTVNGSNNVSGKINAEIDRRLAYQPIGNSDRRLAYAQRMLDDKLSRRDKENRPLTNKDPLDILDFVRKEEKQGTYSDNRTVNVFDFSGKGDSELKQLVGMLQQAIDSGNIDQLIDSLEEGDPIDGEFSEID